MSVSEGARAFLAVAPHCALKRLETPALYDIRADALYELDEEGVRFLAAGAPRGETLRSPETAAFVDFCLAEGLLVETPAAAPIVVPREPPLVPSLRYLLVHLTDRCTLRCRHCFIGPQTGADLPFADIVRLADEFVALQGLRFIVSGGEPLMHRHFWKLNERLPVVPLPLDPADQRHPARQGGCTRAALPRGPGEPGRAAGGPRPAARHRELPPRDRRPAPPRGGRGADLGGERGLRGECRAFRRTGDDPQGVSAARLVDRRPLPGRGHGSTTPRLLPDPARAAALMARSYGGGFYGSSGGWACGAHLAAVMADGTIDKCGYFTGRRSGHAREGLAAAWRRIPRWRLGELACRCSHLAECRGGCRFRAQARGDLLGPDPAMCLLRGVPVGGDRPGS